MNGNRAGYKQCMCCMDFYEEQYDICPYCGTEDDASAESLLQLEPGTILGHRYTVGLAIGSGGFGVTYVGYDNQLNRKVAIKEYLPSEFSSRLYGGTELLVSEDLKKREQYQKGQKRFVTEARKLAQVGDVDGIVRMHDIIEENNTAYIIMEYLEGETLDKFLEREGKCSEDTAIEIMLPVLGALEEVHRHGLIHRDLSPDNIFLALDDEGKMRPRIIDFGSAKFATSSHSRSLTVTIKPGYSPEEQYRSDGNQGVYTDVYAVAAIMYKMVTGITPPDALERRSLLETKKRDLLKPPTKFNRKLSNIFETAILNGMNVKIEDRTPTIKGFISEVTSEKPIKRRGATIRSIDFMTWPLWAKIGVPVLGTTSIAFLLYVIMRVFNPPEIFAVPEGYTLVRDLYKLPYTEAETISIEDQFLLNTIGREYIPGAEGDVIVSQSTPGGTIVQINSTVDVVISAGEAWYHMPPLMGMEVESARAAMECMGLQLEIREEDSSGYRSGCILSQSVDAFEKIKHGSTVSLVVSSNSHESGNDKVKAPDVTGMSLNEALEVAKTAGCTIFVEDFVYTDEEKDQMILNQTVLADRELNDGSLGVVVSYHNREFTLPSLTYIDILTAKQLLRNIGVECKKKEEYSDNITKGLVFAQDVEAETTVRSGDTVQLTCSKGSTPFEMPDLAGMTEADGRKLLEDLGLRVEVSYEYKNDIEDGSIISQSIRAKGNVTRGDTVSIVVCNKGEMIEVPDVVGISKSRAESTLKDAGFIVVTNEMNSNTISKGDVISQKPISGTRQKANTTIVLNISNGQPESIAINSSRTNVSTNSVSTNVATWSEWTEHLPNTVTATAYDIESKTQYSYRTKETTTSTSNTMPGWTLVRTEDGGSGWGEWSAWSTTPVDSSSTTQVENKTQYSYRTMEYTESTSSSMDGWELYNSTTSGFWQGWSDWMDQLPQEYYDALNHPDRDARYESQHSKEIKETNLKTGEVKTWWTEWQEPGGVYVTISEEGISRQETGATRNRYRISYYYRSGTYYYRRWSQWSSFSDTPISASDTTEVITQTLYRYRQYRDNALYFFERYGNWTDYSDTYAAPSDSIEVRTRTVYRYRKK